MLTLDGSTLEGGGQLTRMALCLSAITGRAIKIHSIRAGRARGSRRTSKTNDREHRDSGKQTRKGAGDSRRDKRVSAPDGENHRQGRGAPAPTPSAGGGLKESHLAALHWLTSRTSADVDGGAVGSTEVIFRPAQLKGKFGPGTRRRFGNASDPTDGTPETIELKNPGSVWLIFQAIYPYMVFAPRDGTRGVDETSPIGSINDSGEADSGDDNTEKLLYDLILKGGTNVPMSMATEYVQQVFLPMCERIGLPRFQIDTIKQGWTTGNLQVGEVRIRVFRSRGSLATDAVDLLSEEVSTTRLPSATKSREKKPTSTLAPQDSLPSPNFILQPFTLTDRGEITAIDITILSSPRLSSVLTNLVTATISSHPVFNSLRQGYNEEEGVTYQQSDDLGVRQSQVRNPDQVSKQPKINIHTTTDSGDDRRIYILLVAHTSTKLRLGRDFLGPGSKPKSGTSSGSSTKKREDEEKSMLTLYVRRVVNDLMNEISRGGCVDEFMQDQMVTFQALAEGISVVRGSNPSSNIRPLSNTADTEPGTTLTSTSTSTSVEATEISTETDKDEDKDEDHSGSLHTRTVRWVCEQILDKHGIRFGPDGTCRGIGWNGENSTASDSTSIPS